MRHHYAVDNDSRYIKADKIIACLEYLDNNLEKREVLEIGCGAGIISSEVSRRVQRVTAIDITDEVLRNAADKSDKRITDLTFRFLISDGTNLPFAGDSFDIVICNQVYEHVNEPKKLIYEIYRILKPNGLCYMASPNKLWPMEVHTGLPFLSYLPRPIANKYIKTFQGRASYDIALPTYWRWKQMLSSRFDKIIDLTPLIIKYPQKFHLTKEIPKFLHRILPRIPLCILKIFIPFAPGWITIGLKNTVHV